MKVSDHMSQFNMIIAGVPIRMTAAISMELPEDLQPFVVSHPIEPLDTYDIQVLEQPLALPRCAVYHSTDMDIYAQPDGWLRVFSYLTDENGCHTAVYLRHSGLHTLYLPAGDLDRFQFKGQLSPILGLEWLLLRHQCMILHSSVITYNGSSVLFCGPSGVGKSTQAALWEKHMGAKIINGDRCAIIRRTNGFFGCGSPFSGSSNIYLPEEAPIRGIVFLEQGPENIIHPSSPRHAFTRFYAQTVENTWDPEYTKKLCDLFEQIINTIPLYDLSCLPDQSAVMLVHDTLFANEGV